MCVERERDKRGCRLLGGLGTSWSETTTYLHKNITTITVPRAASQAFVCVCSRAWERADRTVFSSPRSHLTTINTRNVVIRGSRKSKEQIDAGSQHVKRHSADGLHTAHPRGQPEQVTARGRACPSVALRAHREAVYCGGGTRTAGA